MEFKHISVLLKETIGFLNVKADGIYVDGTVGGGGHSLEIAKLLNGEAGGRLICLDQDEEALKAAKERLAPVNGPVTFVKSNFSEIETVLNDLGVYNADGILLDLGVSSYQLDCAERGFSYMDDAPLDMRMDRSGGLSAGEVVNTYSEEDLKRIIKDYGEDRFARNIARNIVEKRQKKAIETTFELRDIVEASIPMKMKKTGGHPAKRTFQAIRIEVNRELEVLESTLDRMIDLLNPGGRLCIITFHSLEDRIVKQGFKKNEDPCICPKDFPVCVCGRKSKGRVITRKAVLPTGEEKEENPRSKSAKLRVFERGEYPAKGKGLPAS